MLSTQSHNNHVELSSEHTQTGKTRSLGNLISLPIYSQPEDSAWRPCESSVKEGWRLKLIYKRRGGSDAAELGKEGDAL